MIDIDRLRELLAKAEKGSVFAGEIAGFTVLAFPNKKHSGWPPTKYTAVTPAQFAQLKTEFPDKWRE